MNKQTPDTVEVISLGSAVLGVVLILDTIKSDLQNPAPWSEIIWRDWLFISIFIIMILLGLWGLKRSADKRKRRLRRFEDDEGK